MYKSNGIRHKTIYKAEEVVERFEVVDARYTESERIFRVQLWKYNPCYFAREGHVAPVSLVCTFKDNQEERIEMCIEQIKSLLESSRQKIAVEVNTTLLSTYWQIGKIIVEDEELHIGDSDYKKQSIRQLSKVLTTEFGF